MNFDDAKDIDNTCCAIHQYIHNWCLDLFTDMEYDVDRERVHVHWFTNQFYPPIYEEAFVRQTSQHGLEKSIGLLLFVSADSVEKYSGSEVIFDTHHFDRSWLNKVAEVNILSILVTPEVSQFPNGWLKSDAK